MKKRTYILKACYLIIGFFCFTKNVNGQDQKLADSLVKIYKEEQLADTAKMELLRQLSFNESRDLKLGLKYAEELISLSEQKKNNLYLYRGYALKGINQKLMGNPENALDAFFKSIEAAEKIKYTLGIGNSYISVADVYSVTDNHTNAMLYYNKAIATLRKTNDSTVLAAALTNAGSEYYGNEKYDSALLFYKESALISEKVNYLIGKAYNLGGIGMIYASTGQNDLAEKNINEAIKLLKENEVYDPICAYLLSMADIYVEKGDTKTALNYAQQSLKLAEQYGLKDQVSEASLLVSQIFEDKGNKDSAYVYYKKHILYRDSVNNIATVQKMADQRTDFEVSKKQTEVDLLNEQKRNQRNIMISLFIILTLGIILLATLYWYYKNIAREKKRSESLLLNILPAATAQELKENGKVTAVKFDAVTVLFTDFVHFSSVAEYTDPEQLVKSIDYYFKAFDEITTKYKLEKIKTVGDSYMCVSGLPAADADHAKNSLMAAKEMLDIVTQQLKATNDLSHFEIRIGLHSGPVVAGIVGIKKWQYDIWGDTVNIASRMESRSEPGKINVSETTYTLLHDQFDFEYRGELEVKNRGFLKMYFLK